MKVRVLEADASARKLRLTMREEGYEVFHPQKHSHLEQIQAYKAATHVIAVDCSPLHLLALVGHDAQKVGVIARRPGRLRTRCRRLSR